jgi:protein MpaA
MEEIFRPVISRGSLGIPAKMYGKSTRGIPLEYFSSADPAILVVAGLHGHEPDSTHTLSAALRSIRPEFLTAAVVLSSNPDGILQGERGTSTGVDPNRNFPTASWKIIETPLHRWIGSGDHKTQQNVALGCGSYPGSEPEVASLIKLVETLKPELVLEVHSPLGNIEDPQQGSTSRWLSEQTGLPLVKQQDHIVGGSFGGWLVEQGYPWVVLELPPRSLDDLTADIAPALAKLLAGAAPIG